MSKLGVPPDEVTRVLYHRAYAKEEVWKNGRNIWRLDGVSREIGG